MADPSRTYALVVGIEKYAAGEAWNLDGPALDAVRFVDWLHNRYVPLENIFLLVSPLDSNRELAKRPGVALQAEATRENISSVITIQLPHKKGDLLVIFWGGHGIITVGEDRRLLYADAVQNTWNNLIVMSLLASLRSNIYHDFRQQICIIDTCANYPASLHLKQPKLAGEEFNCGVPKECEQFVLYSAKAGQLAVNNNKRKTGVLSEAILDELKNLDHVDWPPDMEFIANRLKNKFSSAEQKPVRLWYRSWKGDEEVLIEADVQEGYDYKYDVFLSYMENTNDPRDIRGSWIKNCFYPILKNTLEHHLGVTPKIYCLDWKKNSNNFLSSELKTAISYSRCLIPIWSPSYFFESDCHVHCSVMRDRERRLGYPHGSLIFPVIASDGVNFPPEITEGINNCFDCFNYVKPLRMLEQSENLYNRFYDELLRWAEDVAHALRKVPQWRQEWLVEESDINIPIYSRPKVSQPKIW